jgi:hypothetical protein
MKKQIAGFSVLAAAFFTQAAVVNFTAAEGYSGDGSSWPSRLSNQTNTTDAGWIETVGGGTGRFRVDSNGSGSVNIDGDVGYNKGVYQQGLSASQSTYTAAVGFRFDRSTDELASNRKILAVEFTEAASGGNRLAMQVERMSGANSAKYRLSFWDNTGSSNTSQADGWSDESDWGFADALDATSDALRLELTLSRGVDASSWSAVGVLQNLDTGFSVTNTVALFDTSAAYFTDPLYAVMNSADKDADANISNRVIDQFEVTAIPEPVTLGLLTMGSAGLLIGRRFRQ